MNRQNVSRGVSAAPASPVISRTCRGPRRAELSAATFPYRTASPAVSPSRGRLGPAGAAAQARLTSRRFFRRNWAWVPMRSTAIKKQSYIVSDELPRGGRPTTSDAHLAAVRSEHLATFPDAGPREEGPQDHQVRAAPDSSIRALQLASAGAIMIRATGAPLGPIRCSCHSSRAMFREIAGQDMRDMCSPLFYCFPALGHELVPLVHCGYTGDRS
jgi:hypothetical protein